MWLCTGHQETPAMFLDPLTSSDPRHSSPHYLPLSLRGHASLRPRHARRILIPDVLGAKSRECGGAWLGSARLACAGARLDAHFRHSSVAFPWRKRRTPARGAAIARLLRSACFAYRSCEVLGLTHYALRITRASLLVCFWFRSWALWAAWGLAREGGLQLFVAGRLRLRVRARARVCWAVTFGVCWCWE